MLYHVFHRTEARQVRVAEFKCLGMCGLRPTALRAVRHSHVRFHVAHQERAHPRMRATAHALPSSSCTGVSLASRGQLGWRVCARQRTGRSSRGRSNRSSHSRAMRQTVPRPMPLWAWRTLRLGTRALARAWSAAKHAECKWQVCGAHGCECDISDRTRLAGVC